MTKDNDVNWQDAAMEEQSQAAAVPGHVNMNININLDITPTEDGQYPAFDMFAKMIEGLTSK